MITGISCVRRLTAGGSDEHTLENQRVSASCTPSRMLARSTAVKKGVAISMQNFLEHLELILTGVGVAVVAIFFALFRDVECPAFFVPVEKR